jgi:hypothetical protein
MRRCGAITWNIDRTVNVEVIRPLELWPIPSAIFTVLVSHHLPITIALPTTSSILQ